MLLSNFYLSRSPFITKRRTNGHLCRDNRHSRHPLSSNTSTTYAGIKHNTASRYPHTSALPSRLTPSAEPPPSPPPPPPPTMHSAVPKKKSSNRGGGPLLRRTLSEQQAEAASADASAGGTGDAGRACFTHFAPGKCRVLKFGGSSVGSGERLRGVVQVRMRGDTRRETERGRWEMGDGRERRREGGSVKRELGWPCMFCYCGMIVQ